jgi:hypothetical protein
MKKLFLALLLFCCAIAPAQVIVGNFGVDYVYSAPTGACSSNAPIEVVVGPGTIYSCQSGTWAQISGGGSSAFSAITGGTNTTAAMVVGSGASLTAATGGIITATSDARLAPTVTYYIDGNRTDSYTPTGSIDLPFKTADAAFAAMATAGAAAYELDIAPASYTTTGDLNGPAVPVNMKAAGATIHFGAHALYLNGPFDIDGLNSDGSVAMLYTGSTKSYWANGSITGTIYFSANTQVSNTQLNGNIIIFAGAYPLFLGVIGTGKFITEAGAKTLFISNSNITNSGTGPAIDVSAGGQLYMSDAYVANVSGPVINCANGATLSAPNVFNVMIVGGTGSAPNCGSAATIWTKVSSGVVGTAQYGYPDLDGTLVVQGLATFQSAGAASTASVLFTGAPWAGTGTTSTPGVYIDQGASEPTTWNTGGTELGINTASGFVGNLLDFHINGGASVFSVSYTGGVSSADAISATQLKTGATTPACGTATGILCMGEAGTAGTPTAGVDYIRADSATHSLLMSLNGAAETPLGGGTGTVVASPQYEMPYYSLAGTHNTVTGDAAFTDDGSGNITATSGSFGSTGTGTQITSTATPIASLPLASSVPPVTTGSNITYTYRYVLDGLSISDCTAGLGSNLHWCYSNGTTWVASITGNVSSVGSPVANQVSVWTGPTTIAGDPNFTWNSAQEVLLIGALATQLAPGNDVTVSDNEWNTTLQFNLQNLNSGNNASGDYIVTRNDGSNTAGYADFGCNGSGYNQPAYNSGTSGDCYLYVNGTASSNGNLNEATATPNTAISFSVGGTTKQQTIAVISNASGTAPTLTLQNPLPIIGAALTLTTATQQTTQTFAVNGQALTFTGSYGASGTVTIAGTFTACATSACVGWAMTVAGATNPSNNGTFILTASTSSLLTFTNWFGVSETLPAGAQVTSSANTTSYAGTITGGGATATLPSGAYAGIPAASVAGFTTHTTYNGTTFPVIASTAGYIAVTNAAAAGLGADSSGGTIQSAAVVNSPTLAFTAPYGSGAGTQGTDKWACTDILGSVATNPSSTLTCAHTGTSGTVAVAFPTGSIAGSELVSASVTATQLAAQYSKGSCTEVWGGSGTSFALTSGDDAIVNNSCYNDSGVTRTITAVKCRSDAGSNTTTVNPTFGSAGTGTTILGGALTCGNSYAYSSSGSISSGSWTTGTGIDPVMAGSLTGTSIAMTVEYTY